MAGNCAPVMPDSVRPAAKARAIKRIRYFAVSFPGYHCRAGGNDPQEPEVNVGWRHDVVLLMVVVLTCCRPSSPWREHPRRQDVAIVNILFGWTLIGWVLVFLWAALAHVEEEPV